MKYRVLILAVISFVAVFATGVTLSIVSHNNKNPPAAASETTAEEAKKNADQVNAVDPDAPAPAPASSAFCGLDKRTYMLVMNYHHLVRIEVIKPIPTETDQPLGEVRVEYAEQQSAALGIRNPWVYSTQSAVTVNSQGVVDLPSLEKGVLKGKFTAVTFNKASASFEIALKDDATGKSMEASGSVCSQDEFTNLYDAAKLHAQQTAAPTAPTQT